MLEHPQIPKCELQNDRSMIANSEHRNTPRHKVHKLLKEDTAKAEVMLVLFVGSKYKESKLVELEKNQKSNKTGKKSEKQS
jgi:hypothetical protein